MPKKQKLPKELSAYLAQIGRKGGKAGKGKKGFAALSEEKRREIQEKGWAARRKPDEPPEKK